MRNFGPASCYRDLEGVVHLSGGAIRGAAATSVVSILPAQCRPAESVLVDGVTATSGGGGTATYLAFISGSGIFGIDSGNPPVGNQVIMDSITFRGTP